MARLILGIRETASIFRGFSCNARLYFLFLAVFPNGLCHRGERGRAEGLSAASISVSSRAHRRDSNYLAFQTTGSLGTRPQWLEHSRLAYRWERAP